MSARLLVVFVLVSSGCESKTRWLDIHATEVHVGHWVAKIPEGWRDIHELVDQRGGDSVPGWRFLIPADDRHFGEVSVYAGEDAEAWRTTSCDHIAHVLFQSSHVSDIEDATIAGDAGCLMQIRLGRARGIFVVKIHGRDVVGVRCLGDAGSLDGGSACDRVVYDLHPSRSAQE